MTTIGITLLVALGTAFQVTSTHCSTVDVQFGGFTDHQLIGCGPQYSENVLWNLDRADGITDGTARRSTTGAGSVVYVVDSGVEQSHDEFQREGGTTNVIGGLDPFLESGEMAACATPDTPTHPCYSGPNATIISITHGTAVASIVAGRTTGVAPGASIVAVRVLSVGYQGSVLAVYNRALDDIVKHAFDPATPPFHTAVINMSGTPASASQAADAEFETKMKLMIGGVDEHFNPDPNGKRFLFVITAGNSNFNSGVKGTHGQCTGTYEVSTYPALAGPEIDGLITVGGIDRDNHLWSGSCTGSAVEILAPADHILGASITGHDNYRGSYGTPPFDYSSGTSYAAPYVCGIAARMLETNPNLTPVELETMIKASPSFIDPANGTAAGGRVAVLIENPPPPPAKRRAVGH
jgi:subtilisin family serine protease